jgi:hypothetical protein
MDGVIMEQLFDSPNIRKGRFLWMEQKEKERFISELKAKIAQGYYFSDVIFTKIADDLAPVMADAVEDSG